MKYGPHLVLLSQGALAAFGFTFAPLFFKQQGISLSLIMASWAILALTSILALLSMHVMKPRTLISLSFIVNMIAALILVFYQGTISYIAYSALAGLVIALFWVPINYIFFGTSKQHATDASIYLLLMKGLYVILPLLGGFLYNYVQPQIFFAIIALISLLPVYLVWFVVKQEHADARFMLGLQRVTGIKKLLLVQGALSFFAMAVLPTYVLLFVDQATKYGGFVSYLGFIALVVALFLSKRSDRKQERLVYVKPLMIMMALCMLALMTKNFIIWLAVAGVYIIADNMSSPLRIAILMDHRTKDIAFWKTYEIFLNIGRAVMLGLVSVLIAVNKLWVIFVVYAVLAVLFPYLARN